MADTAVEEEVQEAAEGGAEPQSVSDAPAGPLQIEWTKEFWDSVSDDALPEVYRFGAAAMAASRAKSGVATARQGKLNPTARQVQPGRTVLVREDNVPIMMKIFDTAELAKKFVEYEEGRIPRFFPEANTDPRSREKQPVVWTEIEDDPDRVSKTTHQILY